MSTVPSEDYCQIVAECLPNVIAGTDWIQLKNAGRRVCRKANRPIATESGFSQVTRIQVALYSRLMPNWTIGRLDKSHDRTGFACCNDSLDEWIKSRASQFYRRDLSRTFVAVIQHACRCSFMYDGRDLAITLPSNRSIYYRSIRSLTSNGFEFEHPREGWTRTYGRKLVQNIVQGICRDLLTEFLVEYERRGLPVVMHVHDEVVVEAATPNANMSPPNDSRVSSGVLRSAKSMVQAFQREDYEFKSSASDDELVEVLRELFRLAQAKLNLTFND